MVNGRALEEVAKKKIENTKNTTKYIRMETVKHERPLEIQASWPRVDAIEQGPPVVRFVCDCVTNECSCKYLFSFHFMVYLLVY